MIRAFQWDLARQTERLSWLLGQLPKYADWGYQELYLHLEDAVEYPSAPGVARPGAYSQRQLERLVRAAKRTGISVVPIVNLLGHTQYLIKVPKLRELNERVDTDGRALPTGQICPLHPRTLEVAEGLLRDMAPFCTAGKVHVGLDESYSLGGHPRSRQEIAEVGLAGHFGRYVQRLEGLCRGLGLRMGMWADMLALLPAAIDYVPGGVAAYDWYYYPFRREPAIELHNFRTYDLAPRLKRRGIAYWGCPMSSGFRFEPMPTFGDRLDNARSWGERCTSVGAEGMLVTSWEATRLAAPVVQAVDAAVAELWRSPKLSNERLLAAGMGKAFGVASRTSARMARVALGCDAFAYAGYHRWELEESWSFAAGRSRAEAETERRALRRMAVAARGLPEPFAASVQYRAYLAARDALATRLANPLTVGKGQTEKRQIAAFLKTEVPAGRSAIRAMWRSTRRGRSPQGALLAHDRAEATHAGRSKEGQVHFICRVHNFAPALQKVVLEAETAPGVWTTVRGRFTIEFTRAGARRQAPRLVRSFAAALPLPLPQALRLSVRGLGQVEVSHCRVRRQGRLDEFRTSGRSRVRLGTPAPVSGFPALDWGIVAGKSLLVRIPRRLGTW